MIPGTSPVSGHAISEQPGAEAKTPPKRKINAVADQQSEPEAR